MNGAKLTFTGTELALLQLVLRHVANRNITDLSGALEKLSRIRAGEESDYSASDIAAIDAAFTMISEAGEMPGSLQPDMQAMFHHLKGMFAAAAVD
jgi:hypothetical protein